MQAPAAPCRASAAAARSGGPPRWIDELELVAPWSGVTWVSEPHRRKATASYRDQSSSPAICQKTGGVLPKLASSHLPK